MRKTRNALLGILTMMSGAILAVPTEAAERYIPSAHLYKAVPERLFSYPYGGTHLRVDYAKRRFGYPYVGSYYGSSCAPRYYYDYRSPYYWQCDVRIRHRQAVGEDPLGSPHPLSRGRP